MSRGMPRMNDARASHDATPSIDDIDALLPQTQCQRCGYPACRPYAEAIAAGSADINRCAPGGTATIDSLAVLTGRPLRAPDPDCGVMPVRRVALIDEQWCIGCTVCIRVCPVDAIVGARRLMHTVVADECSGCELCVEPCPVDCIRMVDAVCAGGDAHDAGGVAAGWFGPWTEWQAGRAGRRYRARQQRLARRRAERAAQRSVRRQVDVRTRQAEVLDAVRRVRARRPTGSPAPSGGASQ